MRQRRTLAAKSVGEEGRWGVNGGEGDARKEGEVTAGQTNTRSGRWRLRVRECARVRVRARVQAIPVSACARVRRCWRRQD